MSQSLHGHWAKKRLGQNFLHDTNVIAKIVRAIHPKPDETLVEIGPGLGALTQPLLAAAGRLTAVELDSDVIPKLIERCGQHPGLTVLNQDALKVDFTALAPPGGQLRLVGNLPYNISTPLLFHFLAHAHVIRDMHFMLQKEVVERMGAGPDDEAYGRLSVSLAARAEVTHLFNVGAGSFTPEPKVESAIVRVVPRAPSFAVEDWSHFDQVVAAAFSQRRKTLANSLKRLMSAEQIRAANIDPGLRAEKLAPADFACLAAQLGKNQ